MSKCRFLIKTLIILLAGAGLGLLLMACVFSVRVPESKYDTVFAQFEGGYPRESIHIIGDERIIDENYPDILDYASDYLILRFSVENPSENPILHALRVPVHEDGYYRYWHGYAIVWRLLFLLFDLAELRILNQGVQILLVFALCFLLYRRTNNPVHILAVLTVYYFLMPAAIGNALQYSAIFYVTVIAAILALKWNLDLDNQKLSYYFLIIGMLTSYFDLLTFPLLTWALPVILVIMNSKSRYVVKTIKTGLVWLAGYVVFWVEKWILATLILKVDCFGNAMGAVESRSGHGSGFLSRFYSLTVNWNTFSYAPYLVIILAWVIYWSVTIFKRGFVASKKTLTYAMIALSSIVWCLAASQHTISHHFFTWRIFIALLAAFLAVICNRDSELIKEKRNILLGRVILVAGFIASMIGMLVFNRDVIASNNFAIQEQVEVSLSEGADETAIFTFVPQQNHITEFTPVLRGTGDVKGKYDIAVMKNGKNLYSEELSIDELAGANFHPIKVNWHLSKGESYDLVISAKDLQGTGSYWTVEAGTTPEFTGATSEPAMEFKYSVLPIGIRKKIFCIVSWYGVLLLIVSCVHSFRKEKK